MATLQTNDNKKWWHEQPTLTYSSSSSIDSGYILKAGDDLEIGLQLYASDDDGSSSRSFNNVTDGYDNVTAAFNKWMSPVSLNYTVEMMTVVSVLLFAVIVITAVGNAMVGLALFRYRQLRTVSNYLIGNLALSDFLLATTIFPLSTVNESLGYWPFGRTLCYVWLTLDVLYCTASIWNLCVIAFDRFTATVCPVWYRGLRSAPGRQAAIYAVVVWAVAAIVCVPPLLGWNPGNLHVFLEETGVYRCNLFQNRSYVIYSACGSFFVPFVVTLFLYLDIFVVLRGRMHKAGDKKDAAAKALSAGKGSVISKSAKTDERPNSLALLTTTKVELASPFADSCSSIVDAASAAADIELDTQVTDESKTSAKVNGSRQTPSSSAINNDSKARHSDGAISADGKSHLPSNTPPHRSTAVAPSNGSVSLTVPGTVKRTVTMSVISPVPETESDSIQLPRPTFTLRSSNSFCLSPFVRRKQSPGIVVGDVGVGGGNETAESAVAAQQRRQRQQRASYERREMRATIRMAIIIAFFCGFWLGFFVVYLVQGCCENCQIPRALDAFFFWLGYSNSSVNPILYTIFNEEFRSAFQKILGIGGGKDDDKSKRQIGAATTAKR
jgi:hypothetical protein